LGWDSTSIEIYSYRLIDILDQNGNPLLSSEAPTKASIIAGAFCSYSASDALVVFKDGESIDTGLFKPHDQYGLYCLGLLDDSLQLLWAKDASGYEDNMFYMPSFPAAFFTSKSDSRYSMRSGDDGSIIGTIYGLKQGLNTSEGHFLPLDDSVIQLIQMDGNTVYLYRLVSTLNAGEEFTSDLPSGFILYQNSPNPFNPSTVIEFGIPTTSEVSLQIYNILGQKVASLAQGRYRAGRHSITWDGTDDDGRPAASGVYFCRFKSDEHSATRKMIKLE
jgi:hypothetical protein